MVIYNRFSNVRKLAATARQRFIASAINVPSYTTARAARPAAAPGKVNPGGGLDMLFNFLLGPAQMISPAQAEARAFAKAMAAAQLAGMKFAIEAHTNVPGVRDKNMALSQARAQSVVGHRCRRPEF